MKGYIYSIETERISDPNDSENIMHIEIKVSMNFDLSTESGRQDYMTFLQLAKDNTCLDPVDLKFKGEMEVPLNLDD